MQNYHEPNTRNRQITPITHTTHFSRVLALKKSHQGPAKTLSFSSTLKPMTWVLAFFTLCLDAGAQTKDEQSLPPVTVSGKANLDPVEKSYRKMIRSLDLFDKQRALAPNASLRFKLLARRRDTNMNHVGIDVLGTSVSFSVPISPDGTFALPRNAQAFDENAQVTPNRKRQSMTWRSDIRTPGLPLNSRRLGDLRLECRVGMEAGLVSNSSTLAGRIAQAVFDTPVYCEKAAPLYLFFADRPVFSVALVDGQRREVLAINQLYAAAIDDPKLQDDLPYCDCEVLVDRTYVLPLGDKSWPDDTLVEFEFMDDE